MSCVLSTAWISNRAQKDHLMGMLIYPQAMTIDGLSIRFAEGGKGIEREALTRR
jgi:hypothetical protein